MTVRRTGRAARAAKSRLETAPQWLQGIAAIAGVALTAVAVFGLVGDDDQPPAPTATPTTQGTTWDVTLESVTTDEDEVRGAGSFQGLDPERYVVLFIGQPTTGDGDWLPVVAQLSPASVASDGTQSGDWEAIRPAAPGPHTWYAVIGPRAAGAGDPYVDLRANGPESDLVRAASEPFTTND